MGPKSSRVQAKEPTRKHLTLHVHQLQTKWDPRQLTHLSPAIAGRSTAYGWPRQDSPGEQMQLRQHTAGAPRRPPALTARDSAELSDVPALRRDITEWFGLEGTLKIT